MNNHAFVQKPIRLVNVTQQGKYQIHPDGTTFLSQIQKPLGVVSVAGLYRTGKSYLLNRMLLNKSSGFGVGSTINACTKGLWCWGTPIKGTTSDGQKINVIIIDSEGIGALDQDQNHDTKIFTLAVLAASTFIYNSVGSIDENALQNLSLVANMSKSIQIKACSEQEDIDPEDLSQYFPSFCWIVRDFSLQLINGNGDAITSNEYLERALALQKGFSDDVEDKNRIRRLLTAFFKIRECITLVRPLMNESKLQQLEKLQMQELRPQFVEQVLQLRKKILQKLNPKKFKNQLLDGKMYLNILTSYVSAINEGAVPNMQNAWSYMCQQKCFLTLEECSNKMQKQLRQLQESIPVEGDKINELCDQIQEQVMKKYLDDTKGMQKEGKQLLNELKEKAKHMIRDLKKKNQRQSITLLKSYAFKNFQTIEKMMVTRQFAKFQDYIKQLNSFYACLLQNGPNLPNKELIFSDFTKKAAIQGAELFIKEYHRNFQSKKILWEQEKTQLQKKTQETKSQMQHEVITKKEQLRQMDQENTELLASLETCKEELEKLKLRETQQQTKFQQEMEKNREQQEQDTQKFLQQIYKAKELLQKNQKQKYELQKQIQKSNAIFQLKEQQFIEQIAEYKKKQSNAMTEMIKFKAENQQKYGKVFAEFQAKVQEYKKMYQASVRKVDEMKIKIQQMNETIENLNAQNHQLTQSYQKQTTQMKQVFTEKIIKFEQKISKLNSDLERQKQNYSDLKTQFLVIQSQSSKQSTEIQEKIHKQSADFKKQKAVYEQKIAFLQMELKELQEETKANTCSFEEKIANLQKINKQTAEKFSQEKVKAVQMEIQDKFRSLEKVIQEEKHQVAVELDLMKKEKSNLAFELEMEKKAKQAEVNKYKKIIEAIEHELSTSRQSKKQIESLLITESSQKVFSLEYRIKELQMQLQNYKQQQQNYHQERSNRSQQALMQLKNYHDLEKDKLEEKYIKQKEKYEKKILFLTAEYQEKIKEETNNLEEEFEALREDMIQEQEALREMNCNLQHQLDLKSKTYEGLEQSYTEQKVFYEKKQMQLAHKVQFLNDSLKKETETMQKRIDEALKEKSKFEKQSITLAHQKDEFANQNKIKSQKIISLEQQLVELTKQIQKIKSASRAKESQLQNQFMEKIINYEKKIALNKQENQFLVKKNQDLQRFNENKSKAYEEKIQNLKAQLQNGLKLFDERKTKELNEIEEKYEKLKKSAKESESGFIKRISTLERQLAIEQEKASNFQMRISEHKSANFSIEEKMSLEIQSIKALFNEQKNQLTIKIELLKQTVNQLESEKQSLNSEFEKETILKQNKIKYLEENKQKTRKQIAEKLKKYEELAAKNQKERKDEKVLLETLMAEQTKKNQKKYQQQIQQLTASYEKRQAEWETRINAFQVQNRKLAEKAASSTQFKSETYILQQRKLNELQENEKKITHELQMLKNQSKTHSNDTFLLYQKEKQSLKSKLSEKEEKLRVAQKLKQEYFYELQKQKAKTNVEKESFVMKIEELKQLISKLEKDLEKYQRENEKLKVEKRQSISKNNLSRYSVNKPRFGSNFTERSGLEEGTSFLNMSISSSMRGDKEDKSFSRATTKDHYFKRMQVRLQSKENSEKNSESGREKENFNPILNEESFFNNY